MKQNRMRTQLGNTLTGFIIGLVIGLSIAVVVALVINKASTPFTNKNGKADKTDVPATQMQDPNKPLYGNKDAVVQASKEIAASKAVEAVKAVSTSKATERTSASVAAKSDVQSLKIGSRSPRRRTSTAGRAGLGTRTARRASPPQREARSPRLERR